jgi:multicomponent Na+:H+ antiporter subunit B
MQERSPVLRASTKYIAPAMVIFSIYLLLRGHNEPGGGFIGGLVAAMGAILVHLARIEMPLKLYRMTPGVLMIVGLAIAVLSGVPSLIQGDAYLTSVWMGEFNLPAVGKIKVGTPLFFDLGVYLVVAGVVLMLYRTMEEWQASRENIVTGSN